LLLIASPFLFVDKAIAQTTPTRRVLILTGYDPNHPAVTIINLDWYVVATIAGALLVQASLIIWLLFMRARRRQAERESERLEFVAATEHERLGEIISNVPGLVWESRLDPATGSPQTIFVSDYVEKLMGYRPEEWISSPGLGLKLVHEEDRERVAREYKAALTEKGERVIQFRWLTKDSRTVWVEAHLVPIVDHKGITIGMRGVTLDVTKQKQAESARLQSEERNRAILQAVPDLMFLQTRDGVYLDCRSNDPASLLPSPDGFIGKNMRDILPPDLSDKFAECFQRATKGESQTLEYKLGVNGSLRWFEARIVLSGENILSVVRDVTSSNLTKNALRHNEAQLAGIVGSAMDAIITTNDCQQIVLFNRAAEKMFQYSSHEMLGQPLERLVPERFRQSQQQNNGVLGEHNITRRLIGSGGDIYGLRASGEEFPIEASISQIKVEGQKFFTVILRDITERKLAEAMIKDSEEKYRSVFNGANDAILIHDLETDDIIDVNERMCEMYGFTREETRRLKITDLSANEPPYSQQGALQWVQKTAHGEPQLFEWLARRKSGSVFWVEVNLKRTTLRGKHVLLAVVRDITERKLAVDELRHSEERFAKAFRSNPQPMSITTLAGGLYLDVNESFLTMTGYAREEVIGRTSYELNIWETHEARGAFVQRLNEVGSIVNFETKCRTKEGSFRELLSSAEQLDIAGEKCLLIASSDITERIQAQQALLESEGRFRNMADTAPVMIWVSDPDKRCTYRNKQWLDFTGRTLAEECGNGWAKGVHHDDYERCLENYMRSFDRKKRFDMEYRLRRKDGEYRWVFDTGTPRFSSDGVFLGFIGSCIDITERRQSEEALKEAHAELNSLTNHLEAENIYLQEELQSDEAFGDIVGHSDAIKYVLFTINQVALTDSTVLITGETGTGKELVARAIHGASLRKDRTLIKVNCGALAPTLIESELFGHEKGAFTGAGARKLGRFELASGGTLFLDEIGELPLELQVKLLRVIQEGELERLGGTKTIKTDVRIIAATNRNLKLEVDKGTFRRDLWYRLNVLPITVPPLRQRKEDIPLLVDYFVSKSAKKYGKNLTLISPHAMRSLQAYSWPGNVRELANVIERAVINSRDSVLRLVDRFEETTEESVVPSKTLEEVERDCILRTLETTGWRIEGLHGAAKILGINPSTLRARMIKLGIQRHRACA
jgi:PAS domain S-box-containing protein